MVYTVFYVMLFSDGELNVLHDILACDGDLDSMETEGLRETESRGNAIITFTTTLSMILYMCA